MQKVSCPNCGGQVVFRSAASVMTVCEYCRSTLLKDAESIKNIGKVSEVLEDYSPIQIGTSGSYEGKSFTVVGRIQLRYDAGYWNEWHILFDDTSSGWLSDASGQFVVTLLQNSPDNALPVFEKVTPGARFRMDSVDFFASDIRTARCIAWEGELPFQVGKGWEAKVVDYRSSHRFLTLDYSDSEIPQIYLGKSVRLSALRCQLLRDDDAIADTAGRFKGKTVTLDCPSCGGAIQYQAGMAFHIVCASCHGEVDCSMDKALVLKTADDLAKVTTTLSLGEVGNLYGIKYDVIGLLQCRSSDDENFYTWVEYLLFHAKQGFVWLVETSEGWERIDVLNEWPIQTQKDAVALSGEKYSALEEYDSTVIYAAGAFNWRVSIGDRTHIADFKKGKHKISAESTDKEIVWTSSTPVAAAQVGKWFNKTITEPVMHSDERGASSTKLSPAMGYSVLLGILNLPITFASGARGLNLLFWAMLILWLPVLITRYLNKED